MRPARTRLGARILARSTDARLPARTVRIDRTLRSVFDNHNARPLRIATIAWTARTLRPMIVHSTFGIRSALTDARILTALIATRQRVRTLIVCRAFRSNARHKRIPAITVETVTRRMMTVVRTADGIPSALYVLARIHARPLNARLRRRTVTVRAASHLEASAQSITSETFAANAQRPMQLHMTVGIRAARIRLRARIAALLLDARPIVGAVLVPRAFRSRCQRFVTFRRRWQRTLHISRAVIAIRAATLRTMVDARAERILAARVHARIATLLVEAGSRRRTVVIHNTFRIRAGGRSRVVHTANAVRPARRWVARIDGLRWWLTRAERIADHVGRARTDRIVLQGVAQSGVTANAGARIDAAMVAAGLVVCTVGADSALRSAAGAAGGGAKEAGHAFADRSTRCGCSANGVLAAR